MITEDEVVAVAVRGLALVVSRAKFMQKNWSGCFLPFKSCQKNRSGTNVPFLLFSSTTLIFFEKQPAKDVRLMQIAGRAGWEFLRISFSDDFCTP